MTFPERLLWSQLRGSRLAGFKFRRQHPISLYVVDFYCHQLKLVVELDGMTHHGQTEADAHRQRELERQGLRVIRITNDQVLHHLDAAVDLILAACNNIR